MRAIAFSRHNIRAHQRGVALLEVAIAIVVISIGAIGLAGMQLSAKRAGFEAVQRTYASGLAMDILERMRLNPGVLQIYGGITVGGANTPLATPGANCSGASCTEAQLVGLDLWAWEQALIGATETRAGASVGGLLNPTGCIVVNGRLVQVTIAWEGYETMTDPDAGNNCGTPGPNRHLVVVDTFIADI